MRVRARSIYRYDPVLWDQLDPKTELQPGDLVRVVKLPGCPPPNTMGHCHIETLDGVFAGLVHCNSLHDKRTAQR